MSMWAYSSFQSIYADFWYIQLYLELPMESMKDIKRKAAMLAESYSYVISSEDLVQDMNHIAIAHNANFGKNSLLHYNCWMPWQSTH